MAHCPASKPDPLCSLLPLPTADYPLPTSYPKAMRGRPAAWLLSCVLLAVVVLPFLLFGSALEAAVKQLLEQPSDPPREAALVILLLTSDILLPIPSSFVGTAAGARLGFVIATLAVWTGLTAGGLLGFLLGRLVGRPFARRHIDPDDLVHVSELNQRFGPLAVAMTRPLPVLAEATVLWLGALQFGWRQFWPMLLLSNLGLAVLYAASGVAAREYDALPFALAASLALPLVLTLIVRLAHRPRQPAD